MKKLLFAPVALALAATSCGGGSGSDETAQSLAIARDSLQLVVAQQDSVLSLMNEISSGLNEIKSLENILISSPNLINETPDMRRQIRDDIRVIQQTIIERQQRLNELEERLKRSNSNNALLKQSIASLKAQIAEQESTIDQLRKNLASANIYIDKLTQDVDSLSTAVETTISEKNEVIRENVDLTNELNTCYYVIGSKSELKDHNIISTGFLRKTKIMPDDFEQTYFTRGDKRNLIEIPLMSKKVKLYTNHPASSYEILSGENDLKTLHIINPEKFWETTNYLVLQID